MTTEEQYLKALEDKQGCPLSYDEWEAARDYYAACIVSRMKLLKK